MESEDIAGRMYGKAGEIFERFGGRLLGTEGNSLFAVFETAGKAVEAAVAAQRALAELQFDGIDVSMHMGIHTGEARVAGNDYRGLDVHRAARVASAAHGGQGLATEPTMALTGFSSGDSVAFVDLGEHHLKDLEQPEHLYQLMPPGLRDEFEDGVFAVFLAGLTDPELVPAAVAQSLRVRQQGLTPIWDTVKEYLAGKRIPNRRQAGKPGGPQGVLSPGPMPGSRDFSAPQPGSLKLGVDEAGV